MKRLLLLTAFTLMAMGLAALSGCESSSNEPDQLLTGDTTSAKYQFVDSIVDNEEAIGSYGAVLDLSFMVIDSTFGSLFSAPALKKESRPRFALDSHDEIILEAGWSHNVDGEWHVFAFNALIVDNSNADSLNISAIDSIQFLVNNDPIIEPDSTVNGLKIRAHFDWWVNDSVAYGSGDYSLNLNADFEAQPPTVTINGAGDENVYLFHEDTAAVCTLQIDAHGVIANIVFNPDDSTDGDCPVSGAVSLSANFDLSCTGNSNLATLNIEGGWTITTTVLENGDLQVTYSDGTTLWTVIGPCEDDQPPTAASDRSLVLMPGL